MRPKTCEICGMLLGHCEHTNYLGTEQSVAAEVENMGPSPEEILKEIMDGIPKDLNVNDIQIGGDHYKSEYQHWDMIEEHGIGYLEAAASKYVCRWRDKGTPVNDLTKALHYTEKLISLHSQGKRQARGTVPRADLIRFSELNNLTLLEQSAVMWLVQWFSHADLVMAREAIVLLLQEATAGPSPDGGEDFQDMEADVDKSQR